MVFWKQSKSVMPKYVLTTENEHTFFHGESRFNPAFRFKNVHKTFKCLLFLGNVHVSWLFVLYVINEHFILPPNNWFSFYFELETLSIEISISLFYIKNCNAMIINSKFLQFMSFWRIFLVQKKLMKRNFQICKQ